MDCEFHTASAQAAGNEGPLSSADSTRQCIEI
jgi:hypothetical protein